jgi:arylsulfatase
MRPLSTFGSGTWNLYDPGEDPGGIHDPSDDHPDVKAALIQAWHRYAEENDVFDHEGRFDAMYPTAYGTR